jgi:6-phosphogluconolactonase (cycloisomerase 2 family)
LYALNEASDSITTFRVIGATGQLDAAGSVACRSPICMAFVA